MTAYTLSVVQLCPEQFAQAADAIAEAAGYGPGNLSVRLQDAQGGIWHGCHAWWIPSVFAALTATTGEPAVDNVLAQVITSVREGGDPQQHWQETLAAHGLSPVVADDA